MQLSATAIIGRGLLSLNRRAARGKLPRINIYPSDRRLFKQRRQSVDLLKKDDSVNGSGAGWVGGVGGWVGGGGGQRHVASHNIHLYKSDTELIDEVAEKQYPLSVLPICT